MENSNTTNNPTFLDREQKYDDLFDEFLNTDITNLTNKYGQKKLLEKIFAQDENYSNFAYYLNRQRQLLIARFIPANSNVVLATFQKQQIVKILTTIKPEMSQEQVLEKIKQIQPELQLPEDFQIDTYYNRALRVFTVYDRIENIMLDNLAEDYLIDTIEIYKLGPQQIDAIKAEIAEISDKFEQEFIGIEENSIKEINQALVDQAANLLEKIGRSQFFIKSEKEKASLNHLTDIFIKLEVAAQAAADLKVMTNLNEENLQENALNQIKQVLKPTIQI